MPSHDDCNQCSAQPKPPRHLRHLELCRKLRLLGLCLFSVIRHGGRRDRREKPGIEEQHNTLRLTRIPRDRGQRFFSLRSNEVSTESGSDRVSPRSGRRYKTWGASPRIKSPTIEPAGGSPVFPGAVIYGVSFVDCILPRRSLHRGRGSKRLDSIPQHQD